MKRFNEEELTQVLSRGGYGIAGGIKSGIQGTINLEAKHTGALDNLESDSGDESLGAKKLQVGYSGQVRIRITFYRRRLADYGTGCSRAISEKALVDCLVYAGLIKGDSGEEVWVEDGGQKKVESNEEERTEFEITYPEIDTEHLWVKAKQHLGH